MLEPSQVEMECMTSCHLCKHVRSWHSHKTCVVGQERMVMGCLKQFKFWTQELGRKSLALVIWQGAKRRWITHTIWKRKPALASRSFSLRSSNTWNWGPKKKTITSNVPKESFRTAGPLQSHTAHGGPCARAKMSQFEGQLT
jgi:hypothetical protein